MGNIIQHKTAKLAKEKGFDRYSNKQYFVNWDELYNPSKHVFPNGDKGDYKFCYAPEQKDLKEWLEEVHEIFINIKPTLSDGSKKFSFSIYNKDCFEFNYIMVHDLPKNL